jgi:hypothetical protein
MPRLLPISVAAGALVCLGGAGPPPAALEAAFGNTIVSTYPDNRTAQLWLDPSGRYDAMGRRGDRTSGHWRVDRGNLCLKQDHPPTLPFFRFCTPLPAQDHWTAKAVTGETIHVRLVKGRRDAPA